MEMKSSVSNMLGFRCPKMITSNKEDAKKTVMYKSGVQGRYQDWIYKFGNHLMEMAFKTMELAEISKDLSEE